MRKDPQREIRRGGSGEPARWLSITTACCLLTFSVVTGQAADPYRGLWVGQVSLTRATQVSVPLDADNVAIAPDPEVATPTADTAYLRLILHVNGAGQVSLLKDVAILARPSSSNGVLAAESDMALITDETLYGDVPPQPAVRLASAVFDFGDSRATDALDAMRDAAVQAAADVINAAPSSALDDGSAQADAEADALAVAQPIVADAAVAAAYDSFLRDELTSLDVTAIAESSTPETAQETVNARTAATNLLDSFYADSRGVDLVNDLVAAVTNSALTNDAQRTAAAHAVASSYADVEDQYHRFIAGKTFGDMILACARAGYAAAGPAQVETDVRAAATSAFGEAFRIKVARYTDSRGEDAVEHVVDAIVQRAEEAHSATGGVTSILEDELVAVGNQALAADVARYTVSGHVPTPDYNTFVTSDDYLASAAIAAEAAAEGAVFERENNPLWTEQSVKNAALLAAANALSDLYEEAARAVRNSLPMDGKFEPGRGDPRMTWEIKQGAEAALGDPGVTGLISLPARHPTNPFRHRRHPDHTAGFNILRKIRIDFDASPSNALERAGFGVERITGTYREEIEGLHKLLGPDKDIGLKTEGKFELNHISLIETLNAL
jgi:hypothetical protein